MNLIKGYISRLNFWDLLGFNNTTKNRLGASILTIERKKDILGICLTSHQAKVWHEAFFHVGNREQSHSPDTLGGSKNALGSVSISLNRGTSGTRR